MTDVERKKASIDQIYTYAGSRYSKWQVVAVKSIKKILLNLDDFSSEILKDMGDSDDIGAVRNAWFYEAVAHAEQAIEDLFSTLMCFKDLSFFAKDVLFYPVGQAKRFIWDFDSDNIEYLCEKFGYPYFDLTDPWEKQDVFDAYKNAVLLTQKYVKELQVFHQKYYDDYCQYKHGLSVGMYPLGNKNGVNNDECRDNLLEGALFTFHNGTIADYEKRNESLPASLIQLKPGMQHHIRELHDEGNLLYSTVHIVDMDEVERVTTHACILLDVVWRNIIELCKEEIEKIDNGNDNTTGNYREIAFPMENLKKCITIGFPKDK